MRRLGELRHAGIAVVLTVLAVCLAGCVGSRSRMNYDLSCQKHYDAALEQAVDIDTVWVEGGDTYTYAGSVKEADPASDPYAGDVILRSVIYKPVYKALGEYYAEDGSRMVQALEMTPVKAWVVDGASVKVKVRIFAKTVIFN